MAGHWNRPLREATVTASSPLAFKEHLDDTWSCGLKKSCEGPFQLDIFYDILGVTYGMPHSGDGCVAVGKTPGLSLLIEKPADRPIGVHGTDRQMRDTTGSWPAQDCSWGKSTELSSVIHNEDPVHGQHRKQMKISKNIQELIGASEKILDLHYVNSDTVPTVHSNYLSCSFHFLLSPQELDSGLNSGFRTATQVNKKNSRG